MITKDGLLHLVGRFDGQLSWYSFNRIVNPQELPQGKTTAGMLKELQEEGLVVLRPDEPLPRYALTSDGIIRYEKLCQNDAGRRKED